MMATRKMSLKASPPRPELERLIAKARQHVLTEDELHEQMVSFIYGNAPHDSNITKESARRSASKLLLRG